MLKRVITGAVFTAIILGGIYLRGWALRALMLAAMLIGMFEVYRAIKKTGAKPAEWAGYVYAVLAIALEALVQLPNAPEWLKTMNAPATALVIGLLLGLSAIVLRGRVDFPALSATVLPMAYPGFLFSMLASLQDIPNATMALAALLIAFFLASINDVFALFTGMALGKHKLSPEISPKKTIEGSIGGLIASAVFAMLVAWLLDWAQAAGVAQALRIGEAEAEFSIPGFAMMGVFAGAMSQIGDLTASLVKRHCGVKDYGTIFPGHGGIMDRFDGILFCGAVCAVFFQIMR
ncbi:MAG: phosphatidate cytidylyltransferase [Clostridia bacterium]|nr:phosphatidate cytidylyltransferase [Clostridia bacterium]